MHFKYSYNQVATLALAITAVSSCLIMPYKAVYAQPRPGEKPPPLEPQMEKVLDGIRQNSKKVQNFRARTITLVKTPPNFWADQAPPDDAKLLVNGYDVRMKKDLALFLEGRIHLDQLQLHILPALAAPLFDHRKYWLDKDAGASYMLVERSQFLKNGQVQSLNAGFPTAYEGDFKIPFTVSAFMQIASRPDRDLGEDYISAHLTGEQQFQEFSCLRLEWSSPADIRQGYRIKGFALVCPSRDYKVLYREEETTYQEEATPIRSEKDVIEVDQLTQYGDAWMPTLVNHQWEKVSTDGKKSVVSEVFRVIEFEPDAVQGASIFTPTFSPGTRVFHAGSIEAGHKLEIAGGDTSALEERLRAGDFTLFAPITSSTTAAAKLTKIGPATPRN